VQGAIFLQNAKTMSYEFLGELYGNEMDFTMVPYIPPVVNGIRSIEEPILQKASPGEEIE